MNIGYKTPFHITRTFVLLLLLFATVLCAGWLIVTHVHGVFLSHDATQNRSVVTLAANIVDERISSRLLRLQALTYIPSKTISQNMESVLNKLRDEAARMGYFRISVVSVDGNATGTDGSKFNIAGDEQFQKVSGGFMLTSDIMLDRVKDPTKAFREIVVLEAPYYSGAQIKGTIAATIQLSDAGILLDNINIPYSGASLFLVDKNYNVITHSGLFTDNRMFLGRSCSFFDFMSNVLTDQEAENIRAALETSGSDIYSYTSEQYERYLSFAPLPSTDGWKLIAVSSEDSIRATQSSFMYKAMLLVMAVILIAIFIIGYLYILSWKYQRIRSLSMSTIDKAGLFIIMLSQNGDVSSCDKTFTDYLDIPESKNFSLLRFMSPDQNIFPAAFSGEYTAKLHLTLQNGEEKYLMVRIIGDSEDGYYYTLALDVSADEAAQRKIFDMAYIDQTTRLPNRASFIQKVDEISAMPANERSLHAYLFIDINDARKILEIFAEQTYLKTLLEVSQRLSAVAAQYNAHIYSLDNDDYVILVDGLKDISETSKICGEIIGCFSTPFQNGGNSFMVTGRIGVVPCSDLTGDMGISSSDIFKFGEIAVRHAKVSDNVFILDMETYMSTVKGLDMEMDLRNSIDNNELSLYYQPIYNALEDRISGAEALLRWNSPKHGSVPPSVFIPMAERCGFINKLGAYVTEESMKFATNPAITSKRIKIKFNVSAVQFLQVDFVEKLFEVFHRYSLPPRSVGIEITESAFSNNKDEFTEKLNRIREEGILVSIDDFGTGYSSLSYLKDMPADYMKIDKSFIDFIETSSRQRIIFNSIASLGRALGLKIVVEGVETPEQFAFALESSCDLIQGFLISRPIPEKEFLKFIDSFSIR
ncbi:MAG: EAL domain-containing protein [Synergistaceae bacterium]|nr:EAL domain-containing protein [Synergistaceae bacterium]